MSRQTAVPGSGYRHNRQPRPQQQMDLFGRGLSNGAIGAPAWLDLPAEARAALTSLMTQLILDHAAMTATPPAKDIIWSARRFFTCVNLRPIRCCTIASVNKRTSVTPEM
ncbi:hypothetical protein [Bradyrhizobium sp. USDA 10063]